MKTWTRKHTLLAGGALILLSNAVALLGAAWNRNGDPESTLTLSRRELRLPHWLASRDNSGLALNLQWRTLPPESAGKTWFYGNGAPQWLDRAKLESLGVVFPTAEANGNGRMLSREVLLVLELDGPAYAASLERYRRHAARESARLAALPGDAEAKRSEKNAWEMLKQEENEKSRLFVVDAGLDVAALRTRYPDRQRYAIVQGRIRPWFNQTQTASGQVEGLSVASITVPYRFRPPFEAALAERGGKSPDFAASVAFGQRLEPWIVNVSPRQSQ